MDGLPASVLSTVSLPFSAINSNLPNNDALHIVKYGKYMESMLSVVAIGSFALAVRLTPVVRIRLT